MTEAHVSTLAALVAANPAAARTFDRLGLDFCCHGDRSIDDARAAAGVDAAALLAELAALPAANDHATAGLGATALVAHLLDAHHTYLHQELPALDALAAKVLGVHGDRHPELAEVRRLVTAVREDLEPHLMKEERILFPAIQALAGGQRDFPFGSVANPIRMMTIEHDRTGELLTELRAATGGYAVPGDACGSFRALYERLDALEVDTHRHTHEENHVLFPAALHRRQEHHLDVMML